MSYWGQQDDFDLSGLPPPGIGPDTGNMLELPSFGTASSAYPPVAPSYPIASPPMAMPTPAPMSSYTPSSTPFSSATSPFGGPSASGLPFLDSGLLSSILSGNGGGSSLGPMSILGGGPGLSGAIGGDIGSLLTSIIGGGGSNFNQGDASMGGNIGGMVGGLAGMALGPLGSLGGAAIGDLLGGLLAGYLGGGLPRMAKPQGFVNALEGSGNPLEAMLGQYIQKYGINQNLDLSQPTNSLQPTAMANVLELLSGTQLPDLHGTTLTPQGQVGYKNPVGLAVRKLENLKKIFPNATNLNLAQIKQILPEITNIIERRFHTGAGTLRGLLGQENELATKLRAMETY